MIVYFPELLALFFSSFPSKTCAKRAMSQKKLTIFKRQSRRGVAM